SKSGFDSDSHKKKEALEKKFARKILTGCGAIGIDRDNPSLETMLKCIKILKGGQRLVVYPEGTRNKNNTELQELKNGAEVFAVKAKCKIVPVMLSKKPKLFRKTEMVFGTPFELSDYYGKKITETDTAEMNAILRAKMLEVKEKNFVKALPGKVE
ncbi:MAG: 1-acyl-sn-glycerol-3-phosphate acyltransferase, partial [Clostridia bacterium]|nr:1-acyl-sn-glycerol-3-phosphate acyltransferase [Clostridia bacterium]